MKVNLLSRSGHAKEVYRLTHNIANVGYPPKYTTEIVACDNVMQVHEYASERYTSWGVAKADVFDYIVADKKIMLEAEED